MSWSTQAQRVVRPSVVLFRTAPACYVPGVLFLLRVFSRELSCNGERIFGASLLHDSIPHDEVGHEARKVLFRDRYVSAAHVLEPYRITMYGVFLSHIWRYLPPCDGTWTRYRSMLPRQALGGKSQ